MDPVQVIVTCTTTDCPNADVALVVFDYGDGVMCGPCGASLREALVRPVIPPSDPIVDLTERVLALEDYVTS